MDEYNLAEAFLNFEELSPSEISAKALYNYQKIPFTELAGIGGAIAELIPQFRTITTKVTIDGSGLFKAIDPKSGQQLFDLQYKSKQVADAFVGAMKHADGKFDQAAFIKAGDVAGVAKAAAAINPAIIMIGITIAAMSRKLDKIQDTQQMMLDTMETDKKTSLAGTLNFLLEVFSNYRFNYDNAMYKSNTHLKTQDIKQDAEHNTLFYEQQINSLLERRKLLTSRIDISKNMNRLIELLSNFRLSIYLYSFASFLEVILLENYKKDFLDAISKKIREFAFAYTNLYSKCYVLLSDSAKRSIEAGAMKAVAAAAKGTGKLINKIPIVERGQLDENLIEAGDRLCAYKDESADELIKKFTVIKDNAVIPFADLVDSINAMHNEETEILFDSENLYVKATA